MEENNDQTAGRSRLPSIAGAVLVDDDSFEGVVNES